MTRTPEEIAAEYAYTVDAYQDSAQEVGHPDGQPIIETFPQLAGIIERAIQEDRTQFFDTAGSASSQHYIDTGRYMLHEEVAEMAALNHPTVGREGNHYEDA